MKGFQIPALILLSFIFVATLASCSHSSEATTCSPTNLAFDKNGDGKVKIGVATPGPRNDGGYYQALVETAQEISIENCYEEVVVVDNISAAEARSLLRGLALQNVDVIAVGAESIADPLDELIPNFNEIIWYCNCGSGYREIPRLIQSRDDSSEINYSAGYATGLLFKRTGGSKALFLGCCDLPFEKESFRAFEEGLKAQDELFSAEYIPTGGFDNIDDAVQALEAQKDSVDAVYPFLGGAHEPVVQRANEENILALSAGASTVCERTDLDYAVAVRFDGGDYIETIFNEIIAGELGEGEIRTFRVGVDEVVGAKICNPEPADTVAMEKVYADIASGQFMELFESLKLEAYSAS